MGWWEFWWFPRQDDGTRWIQEVTNTGGCMGWHAGAAQSVGAKTACSALDVRAKYTIRVSKLFLQKCAQPHDDCPCVVANQSLSLDDTWTNHDFHGRRGNFLNSLKMYLIYNRVGLLLQLWKLQWCSMDVKGMDRELGTWVCSIEAQPECLYCHCLLCPARRRPGVVLLLGAKST